MKLTEKHWQAALAMLPQNAEKELLNGQFVPWFLPGDKLVFKKDKWVKKNKVSQYMLVDCKTGVQKELFDHRKLQVRLRRIGINYADGELPDIEPLSVDENGAVRFLMPGGDEYQFDDVRLQRIRKALPEAPAYSPDRRWAVTIRRNNLHLHDRKNGLAGRITKDGKPYNAYATRIEADNFYIRHQLEDHVEPCGVVWAPDSSRFLTYRLDQRDVQPLYLLQSAPRNSMRPVMHEYRYALPGEPIPTCTLYIGDAETGAVRPVQCPPLETPVSVPTAGMLGWSAEGGQAGCWRKSRDNKSVEFYLIDPATGETRLLFTEQTDTFLFFDFQSSTASRSDKRKHPTPCFMLSEKLHSLFWLSERDGFMHIYQYDTENEGQCRQLTQGEFTVCQLLHLDAEGQKLYFTACGREPHTRPYQRYLYAVDLVSGEVALLSRERGDHCIFFSPDGVYYTDTVSACDEPQVTTLCRLHAAEGEQPIQLCACDDHQLVKQGMTYPIFFTEKGADDETDVTGVIVMPAHFRADKKYPVVDYYYGGNQTYNQPNTFYDYLNAGFVTALAQLECVCVIIDGRGTPMRGRAYHQYCYCNMGDCAGLQDHVAVINRLCEKYPFMDRDRVGVWGHSGGGFGTLHCMVDAPELYKVGVASGGNHYQELYNAGWAERFMGGYDADKLYQQSVEPRLDRLEGKLMLIHGELDDNVHPGNTMRIADELIRLDKDFDMLIIPNRHHQLRDMPYYQRRVIEFLARNLYALR